MRFVVLKSKFGKSFLIVLLNYETEVSSKYLILISCQVSIKNFLREYLNHHKINCILIVSIVMARAFNQKNHTRCDIILFTTNKNLFSNNIILLLLFT